MILIRKETPRLILRDVRLEDAEPIFAFSQTEDFLRWSLNVPQTLSALKEKMESMTTLQDDPNRSRFLLTAQDKNSGVIVGDASVRVVTPGVEATIGWGLAQEHRGKGLAFEVGRTLLDTAFNDLKVHRVFAMAHIDNAPSIRLMEKLGMTREGILREHVWERGMWWTSVQYSILEQEFRASEDRR